MRPERHLTKKVKPMKLILESVPSEANSLDSDLSQTEIIRIDDTENEDPESGTKNPSHQIPYSTSFNHCNRIRYSLSNYDFSKSISSSINKFSKTLSRRSTISNFMNELFTGGSTITNANNTTSTSRCTLAREPVENLNFSAKVDSQILTLSKDTKPNEIVISTVEAYHDTDTSKLQNKNNNDPENLSQHQQQKSPVTKRPSPFVRSKIKFEEPPAKKLHRSQTTTLSSRPQSRNTVTTVSTFSNKRTELRRQSMSANMFHVMVNDAMKSKQLGGMMARNWTLTMEHSPSPENSPALKPRFEKSKNFVSRKLSLTIPKILGNSPHEDDNSNNTRKSHSNMNKNNPLANPALALQAKTGGCGHKYGNNALNQCPQKLLSNHCKHDCRSNCQTRVTEYRKKLRRIRQKIGDVLGREEATKYLVIFWFLTIFALCYATFEIVDHLENNQNAALLCLLLIVFLGYGGCGIMGGALLIKRCCMDDPRKRLYEDNNIAIAMGLLDEEGDGRGKDNNNNAWSHDGTSVFGFSAYNAANNNNDNPYASRRGSMIGGPGSINNNLNQQQNRNMIRRPGRRIPIRHLIPDFYPIVHLGKNFRYKEKYLDIKSVNEEIQRLDTLMYKMDFRRKCVSDKCEVQHAKSIEKLQNLLETDVDSLQRSKG